MSSHQWEQSSKVMGGHLKDGNMDKQLHEIRERITEIEQSSEPSDLELDELEELYYTQSMLE